MKFKDELKKIFGLQKEEAAFPFHENNLNKHCFFKCVEGSSIEIEYLDLIRGLIFATKPKFVLETGPFKGYSTIAIASALKENGFGKVYSIEISDEFSKEAKINLEKFNLDNFEIINKSSLSGICSLGFKFSFVLLDSGSNSSHLSTRIDELELLIKRNMLEDDCFIVIHDTSKFDKRFLEFRKQIEKLCYKHRLQRMSFDLSRGINLLKFEKQINPFVKIFN